MKLAFLTFTLLAVSGTALSARILAVFPFAGKSHYIFISSILRTLIEDGHHVVEIGPFKPSKPLPNHIEVHTSFEDNINNWNFEEFSKAAAGDKMFGFMNVWFMTYQVCEETFKHAKVQKLLRSNEHFDLVLTESTFGQESMLVFGHRFNAPTVTVQGFGLMSFLNANAGNSLSIASIPDIASFAKTDNLSFTDRLLNVFSISTTLLVYYLYHIPKHDKLMREFYDKDTPPLKEMVTNVSLYIINSHPAIEYTQPYPPNVTIAGIAISPDRIPLPQDIKKFMDEAKDGVVYFSLGTVVPAHVMPQEILQVFVKVFSKMKQRVLWKIELENIPGLPDSVMLKKWVPQPGVLAHPKCRLFLTHGGLFGQHEAINAGVPLVSIPFFGDQPYNARLSEHRGLGLTIEFATLSEQSVSKALKAVLDNPRFKENALRLSRLFKDQPQTPGETVVFWTDYVLRHRGAKHLTPAAAHMPLYQLALLDVVGVVLAAVTLTLFIFYKILRTLVSIICGNKSKAQITKEKKKK